MKKKIIKTITIVFILIGLTNNVYADKLKSKDGDGDFESERASWIEKYTTARATAQGFLDEVHRDVVPLKAPIKPPPKKVVEDDGTRKLGRINRDRRLD